MDGGNIRTLTDSFCLPVARQFHLMFFILKTSLNSKVVKKQGFNLKT